MDEVLTMAEIEARYPSEWVLIGGPKTNEALEVLSGRVLLHNPDRDEFDRQAVNFRGGRSAIIFTGEPPPDVDGLLGPDFLRGLTLTVDFRTGRLSLN